jgi:hypothetical protein
MTKRCPDCGEAKLVKAFSRDKRQEDGRCRRCKRCQAEYHRRWREGRREKDAQRQRDWRAANPGKLASQAFRSRVRNPEKHKARNAAKNAVRDGVLRKPDLCEDCGVQFSRNELHAHHDDYNKPLDVRWLCRPCHDERHHG